MVLKLSYHILLLPIQAVCRNRSELSARSVLVKEKLYVRVCVCIYIYIYTQRKYNLLFKFYYYYHHYFWLQCAVCCIFVPQPGIEPMLPAMEAWSLNR